MELHHRTSAVSSLEALHSEPVWSVRWFCYFLLALVITQSVSPIVSYWKTPIHIPCWKFLKLSLLSTLRKIWIFVQYLSEDSVARIWKENWTLFLTLWLWVALHKVFHSSVRCNDIICNYPLGSLEEKKWKLRGTIVTYDHIQPTAAVFFVSSSLLPPIP